MSFQSPYPWGGRESYPRTLSLGARTPGLAPPGAGLTAPEEGAQEGELTCGARGQSVAAILGNWIRRKMQDLRGLP